MTYSLNPNLITPPKRAPPRSNALALVLYTLKKNHVLYWLAARLQETEPVSWSEDSGLEGWSTGCLATSGNLYPSCTRYIIAELWDCIVIYALVHTKLSSQPP